jgi:hypothetical protein
MEILIGICCLGVLFVGGLALAPFILSSRISRRQEGRK